MFDAKTKHQMYVDIYDDAMWLINLVENLLSVSRLEGGQMNLHLSTELIGEVVAEALRHINRRSAEHHLHIQSGDEYLLAQMDAHLIVQVIINIVDNAIKYTPPGSDIEISWERQGRFAALSVADNGPGIPDSAKPRVFDMFYSASNRIADSRRSSGAGLRCASLSLRPMAGRSRWLTTRPMGQFLRLPYQLRRLNCMNKPLILVVEDDAPVRSLITTTLRAHDYRFLSAANGESAILEASSHNPDIMLLDLGLPDLDGVEVIHRVRTWSNLPIIVISARSEDTDKIEALDAGADDYLTKPFSVEELLARLRVTQRRLATLQAGVVNEGAVFTNGRLKVDYAAGARFWAKRNCI